jgi:hypothetical protein
MASTLVALQTVTVGAGGVASVTFSSIPQTYTDLVIKVSARTSQSGVYADGLGIQFNSDAANNYSQRQLFGNGTTTGSSSSTQNFAYGGPLNAASSTANTFGSIYIYIPNYISNNYKSISVDSVTEGNATGADAGFRANIWNSTNAINSIRLYDFVTGNLVQYSTFTLYGVYKDAAETTPAAPTIGTATAGSQAADVAFTPAGSGAPASSYVVTSSPGGLTATGGSSPIQVGGLTSGTAYTFTVRGQNPGGLGAASAASNSVTPYDGYESIATVYPTGTTATFSSIPSTYTHLQVRVMSRSARTGSSADELFMTINSTSLTRNHYLLGVGSSVLSGSATAGWVGISTAASATAGMFGTSVIDILDYADTNKNKTTRSLTGLDTNGYGEIYLLSNFINSTSAISTLAFTCSGSNSFASGTVIELYGIRG